MEIAFEAIGLEIPNEKAFHNLAQNAGKRGEISCVPRKSGMLHGRCWRLGEGLEVWTVLYESETGEIFQADCRPGFRARFAQRLSPWIMTEFDEEGEALVHGFIEDTDTEVLFELQNLTEVGTKNFQQNALTVGLCGLAYQAEVLSKRENALWKSLNKNLLKHENDWQLRGEILAFNSISNPYSGSNLYWVYLALNDFELEVLVNQRALCGELSVGAFLKADVWLQGHILSEQFRPNLYEGIDFSVSPADFWKKFKRLN
jgi:hypothetical protein